LDAAQQAALGVDQREHPEAMLGLRRSDARDRGAVPGQAVHRELTVESVQVVDSDTGAEGAAPRIMLVREELELQGPSPQDHPAVILESGVETESAVEGLGGVE